MYNKNVEDGRRLFAAAALGETVKELIGDYDGKVSSEEIINAIKHLIEISAVTDTDIDSEITDEKDALKVLGAITQTKHLNKEENKTKQNDDQVFIAFDTVSEAIDFIKVADERYIVTEGLYEKKDQLILCYKPVISENSEKIQVLAKEFNAKACSYISTEVLGQPVVSKENKNKILKELS